jgi:hypothetical protein
VNGLPIDTSGTLSVTTYPIRRTRNVGIGVAGSVIVRIASNRRRQRPRHQRRIATAPPKSAKSRSTASARDHSRSRP